MDKNYLYTLAFIEYDNKILMLNRIKQPWLGCWNGVGGKKELGESAIDCIKREIFEETSITVDKTDLIDCGLVTWDLNNNEYSGLHLFYTKLDKNPNLNLPSGVAEGILDWKSKEFLIDLNNLGIARNIPYFINDIINFKNRYNHVCIFKGNDLISVTKKVIE